MIGARGRAHILARTPAAGYLGHRVHTRAALRTSTSGTVVSSVTASTEPCIRVATSDPRVPSDSSRVREADPGRRVKDVKTVDEKSKSAEGREMCVETVLFVFDAENRAHATRVT